MLNKIVKLYNREMDTVAKWVSSGTTYLLQNGLNSVHLVNSLKKGERIEVRERLFVVWRDSAGGSGVSHNTLTCSQEYNF